MACAEETGQMLHDGARPDGGADGGHRMPPRVCRSTCLLRLSPLLCTLLPNRAMLTAYANWGHTFRKPPKRERTLGSRGEGRGGQRGDGDEWRQRILPELDHRDCLKQLLGIHLCLSVCLLSTQIREGNAQGAVNVRSPATLTLPRSARAPKEVGHARTVLPELWHCAVTAGEALCAR